MARNPKQDDTEAATAPEPLVIAAGALLPLTVKVLRIVGAYVHVDVLGSPVVMLSSTLRRHLDEQQ